MGESPQHIKAKNRLAVLMRQQPDIRNVDIEHNTGVYVPTDQGPKPYIADVYCERILCAPDAHDGIVTLSTEKIDLEADGPKGHNGVIAHRKNIYRDKLLKEHGTKTARIPTKDLVGRKAMSDADILKEIQWQLIGSSRSKSGGVN